MVDSQVVTANIDAVANVVRVLDEQEDARTENLLGSDGENKGQREECGTSSCESGGEVLVEESNKGEDDDDEDNDHEQSIQDVDGLIHIMHAGSKSLAVASNLNDLLDGFFERNVSVAVLVKHHEGFFSILLVRTSKNILDIFFVEGILSIQDKRHPQTSCESLGGASLLEGFCDNGVGAVGIKDLLSSNFLGNVAKGRMWFSYTKLCF